MHPSRRDFLKQSAAIALLPAGAARVPGADPGAGPGTSQGQTSTARTFRISLAQWSLHRTIRAGQLDHLDFAAAAKQDYGVEGIEYVNSFFMDRAQDAAYLAEMNRRANYEGVTQHLIMCDGEGRLGDPDAAKRAAAVENHRKWLDAARTLGCVMIRVNAASTGSFDEQQKLAADGLAALTAHADKAGLSVVVENHGGLSSNGQWLAGVMKMVNHPRLGTLPDFGNFYEYDRYQGVADLMPFAKAVSAKSHDFDADGNESTKDFPRLMKIVLDAGYRGWVGIEYEGSKLSEREGILKTRALLERILKEGRAEARPSS
jgi:sugar phosphate isomerase/epimerase